MLDDRWNQPVSIVEDYRSSATSEEKRQEDSSRRCQGWKRSESRSPRRSLAERQSHNRKAFFFWAENLFLICVWPFNHVVDGYPFNLRFQEPKLRHFYWLLVRKTNQVILLQGLELRGCEATLDMHLVPSSPLQALSFLEHEPCEPCRRFFLMAVHVYHYSFIRT